MGRVAVDFGVGQGAKRSADIRSDLGQASNPERFRGWVRRSFVCSPAGMRLTRFLPSALLPLRATHSSISTVS